jgi:hypothetical protein
MAIMRRGPVRRQFPEIGRLYKGTPKTSGKIGKDYKSHYLRFQPDQTIISLPSSGNFENLGEELLDSWENLIAQQVIDIRLPYPTITENFWWANEAGKEFPKGYRTLFRCDGETMFLRTEFSKDSQGKNLVRHQAGEWTCEASEDGVCPHGCEPKGFLNVIIPALYPAGIVMIPLNSPVDISTLEAQLAACEGAPDLRNIPFKFYRAPKSLTWKDQKGDTQVTPQNWGLNLMIDPSAMLALLGVRENNLLAEPSARLALPQQQFKNSAHGFIFQEDIRAAKAAGSPELVHQAVDAALEVAGLYDAESTRSFITYEADRALDMIEESSFPVIAGEERQRLFDIAREAGLGNEDMRLTLQNLGIHGQIPLARLAEVEAAFAVGRSPEPEITVEAEVV